MTYIEDYLEHICKEHLNSLNSTDAIYYSIYKQTVRGLGLTDRQYNLVLQKINEFVVIDDTVPTRVPLRQIDRSKYVKIVDTMEVFTNQVHESFKADWKWLKVRFPFSKKDIVKIDSIQVTHSHYYHSKGSHEHYYKLTPQNVYKVITAIQNRNFNIDSDILEYYNQIKKIKETEFDVFEKCLPKEINLKINNMSNLQQADRQFRYGYKKQTGLPTTAAETIAFRTGHEVCIDPDTFSLDDVVQAIVELDRFPLLVVIDEDYASIQLQSIHSSLSKYVPNNLQSVLFRVDSKDEKNSIVNDYVKDNELNNWVDENTKVVYIKKNKLPKVLLQTKFNPICTLGKNSTRCSNHVQNYINMFCDCVVYHDKQLSVFRRYSYAGM